MLPINKKLIKYNYSSRNGQSIQYIVIHDTCNKRVGADAEASWHCGDGKGKYGITNQNSIGVEICINADGDYEKAAANTVDLVKHLMDKYSIPPERWSGTMMPAGKSVPAP